MFVTAVYGIHASTHHKHVPHICLIIGLMGLLLCLIYSVLENISVQMFTCCCIPQMFVTYVAMYSIHASSHHTHVTHISHSWCTSSQICLTVYMGRCRSVQDRCWELIRSFFPAATRGSATTCTITCTSLLSNTDGSTREDTSSGG